MLIASMPGPMYEYIRVLWVSLFLFMHVYMHHVCVCVYARVADIEKAVLEGEKCALPVIVGNTLKSCVWETKLHTPVKCGNFSQRICALA
jgi:hypothetical protein